MNNPKDITMATGYMVSYFCIIKFLKQLPKPSLKFAIYLGLGIGLAMGIRIGGLLLIPYTFLFYGLAMIGIFGFSTLFDFSKFMENVWPSFRLVLLASALGYCLSLPLWPYGLVSPFKHPLEALTVAEKFPITIRFLFDGKHITSAEVPWNYIPQWMAITTPLFGLIGLALSFLLIPYMKRNGNLLYLAFLYFTLVFPICYVIYKKSPLYDSMRHMFFVYPSIIMLAGLAFNYLLNLFSKNLKYATAAIIVVLILLPARFMFANHPNEYVYFNELEGGIQGAYGNYETDYYMNSVKQDADWLKEHENLKQPAKRLRLITNAVAPCNFYFQKDSATVGVGYTSYRSRGDKDADYEILFCRFVDRELLLHGAFPPEQSVHVVYADGVPLSCVIKKEDKRDYDGVELMGKGDFAGAAGLLEPYSQKYPKDDLVLANLGLCYLNVQRFDDAGRVLNQCVALDAQNTNAAYYLGLSYFYKKDFSSAANVLTNVVKENQYFAPPYRVLAECMMQLGDRNAAQYYMGIYQQLGGGR
jgi:tetratricopeptide (TPR) repeat protein